MNFSRPTTALILAAGKGTRMKSELPKVATILAGKPLLIHVIDSLKSAGIQEIRVVVGYRKEVVFELLKDFSNIQFVEQTEQLGTGHAVLCAEENLKNFRGNLLVCCGDVPAISPSSFQSLINFHQGEMNSVTVLSARVGVPKGYGRMVRDKNGHLEKIIEEKDASDAEKQISEVNTGTYIFESPTVFENLKLIGRMNAQNEYYLPDLIGIYRQQNHRTDALCLENPLESSGVNSPEDLANLERLIQEGLLKK